MCHDCNRNIVELHQDKMTRECANYTGIYLRYMPMTPHECGYLETKTLLSVWSKGATPIHQYDRDVVKHLQTFDALSMRHRNDRNVIKLL